MSEEKILGRGQNVWQKSKLSQSAVVSLASSSNVQRVPKSPPPVKPNSECGDKPVWSVMIPAFNCGAYLAETLLSVLEQDFSPEVMQITVVDDASTDIDVEKLVRTIGQGRIEYIGQLENVGSLRNFNTCVNQARGRYVHLLHCDDRVLPGFYSALEELFLQNPEAGACFTRYRYINEKGEELALSPMEAVSDGILKRWLERIASQQRIQYVAIAVRRRVYEE